MKVIPTKLDGVVIIEPRVFQDDRGFFFESWNEATFAKNGLVFNFVQDNHSRSQKGVLRGLHFQNPAPQGKLVRVTRGAVFDVAVDVRRSSKTFGLWIGVELSEANRRMLYMPEGFAHGFLTLENNTDFLYKCTSPYVPDTEHSIAWDDPAIGIEWPLDGIEPALSGKDRQGVSLADAAVFP